MSSLLEAAMAAANPDRLAGFAKVGKLPTKFGSTLPAKLNEVSIMTIEEAYVALGGTLNEFEDMLDPTQGHSSSTYYIYAIRDTFGANGAWANSTPTNLEDIGIDWYTKLKISDAVDGCWITNDHTVFGGPLHSVYVNGNGHYGFRWHYSQAVDAISNSNEYWCDYPPKSAYVVIVRARPSEADLPLNPGDVSIMTLKQAFEILGGKSNDKKYHYDPTAGYDFSTYYMYAINDHPGEDDSRLSTAAYLETIDVNWYKQLNRPTTRDNHWIVNGHNVFGGPLHNVYLFDALTYGFSCYYSNESYSDYFESHDKLYWGRIVDRDVNVVIVRAK